MINRISNNAVVFGFLILTVLPTYGGGLPSGELECGRMNPEGANIGMYGPFDYYKPKEANAVMLVESAHFTRNVESLRRGNTAEDPAGDLRYTLMALPNHPRALQTLIALARKEGTNRPKNMRFSVECYFDRALRFRPNDGVVKVLFGIYLATTNRYQEAKVFLESAREQMAGLPNYHYNFALVNVAMKDWTEAVQNAAKAYLGGYDLPGLKKKLNDAGKWNEVERVMVQMRESVQEPTPRQPEKIDTIPK